MTVKMEDGRAKEEAILKELDLFLRENLMTVGIDGVMRTLDRVILDLCSNIEGIDYRLRWKR